MINFPDTINVVCDECGTDEDLETTEYIGDPPSVGIDDSTFEEHGWTQIDGEHLCPECN